MDQESKARSKKRVPSRILSFKTIEEEAAFWDEHSFEEFEDELELIDVVLVPAGPKSE